MSDLSTRASSYLDALGVTRIAPAIYPFDPGYDAATLEAHLAQSGHLMAGMKLSMACWQIAAAEETARKVAAIHRAGIPAITGGGPFEVAVQRGMLGDYLDLCACLGADRIEAGEGFTDLALPADEVVRQAAERSLEVQFELGKKHEGAFTEDRVQALLRQGHEWLDAGACDLVIEARESACAVGLFNADGVLNRALADAFVTEFGLSALVFEAPDKASQFAMLDHFGPEVKLSNVRLEEVLRVEIYRRGLHSDAFEKPGLAPAPRSMPMTA